MVSDNNSKSTWNYNYTGSSSTYSTAENINHPPAYLEIENYNKNYNNNFNYKNVYNDVENYNDHVEDTYLSNQKNYNVENYNYNQQL